MLSSGLGMELRDVWHLPPGGWGTLAACHMERDPQGLTNPTPGSGPRDGTSPRKPSAARPERICESPCVHETFTGSGRPAQISGVRAGRGGGQWPLGTRAAWAPTCSVVLSGRGGPQWALLHSSWVKIEQNIPRSPLTGNTEDPQCRARDRALTRRSDGGQLLSASVAWATLTNYHRQGR